MPAHRSIDGDMTFIFSGYKIWIYYLIWVVLFCIFSISSYEFLDYRGHTILTLDGLLKLFFSLDAVWVVMISLPLLASNLNGLLFIFSNHLYAKYLEIKLILPEAIGEIEKIMLNSDEFDIVKKLEKEEIPPYLQSYELNFGDDIYFHTDETLSLTIKDIEYELSLKDITIGRSMGFLPTRLTILIEN